MDRPEPLAARARSEGVDFPILAMRGGQNTKPAEQRRREGNPGKRAIPEPTKIGARKAPKMPATPPEEAKRAWRQIVPLLDGAKEVREADLPELEALCTAVARMRQARKALKKHGSLFTTGSTGQLVEHPALKVERDAMKEIARFGERFGLDPMARTRLGSGGERGKDMGDDMAGRIGESPRRLSLVEGGQG